MVWIFSFSFFHKRTHTHLRCSFYSYETFQHVLALNYSLLKTSKLMPPIFVSGLSDISNSET